MADDEASSLVVRDRPCAGRRYLVGLIVATTVVFLVVGASKSTGATTRSAELRSVEADAMDAISARVQSLAGGDWRAVRCVSSAEGTWHPATDMLMGTEAYGTPGDDATWSVAWDWESYGEMLLALTDASYWLVIDKGELKKTGGPVSVDIKASSASPDAPSRAEWYIRGPDDEDCGKVGCSDLGALEDPWASVYDHGADEGGYVYGGNAKTGHLEHVGSGVGACVFVR